MDLDLDTRAGWPPDLRIFIERFPRPVWNGHSNLGPMARFWLDIHDGFRRHGDLIRSKTVDFRSGLVAAGEFRPWLAPRLRMFLGHLEAHHQIEDFQFFPLFGRAEPRLVRGFEVLEQDHHVIHESMDTIVAVANDFLRAPEADRDALLRAADRFAETGDRLIARLIHHLDDEEDLVVPLILDRGEGPLGI
jgi:hypothetical protein